MRYRKLRIAWLTLWLAFSVLAAMRMQIQLGFRFAPDWLLAMLCVVIAVAPWFAGENGTSMSRGFKIFLVVLFGLLSWITIVDLLADYLHSRN